MALAGTGATALCSMEALRVCAAGFEHWTLDSTGTLSDVDANKLRSLEARKNVM